MRIAIKIFTVTEDFDFLQRYLFKIFLKIFLSFSILEWKIINVLRNQIDVIIFLNFYFIRILPTNFMGNRITETQIEIENNLTQNYNPDSNLQITNSRFTYYL